MINLFYNINETYCFLKHIVYINNNIIIFLFAFSSHTNVFVVFYILKKIMFGLN